MDHLESEIFCGTSDIARELLAKSGDPDTVAEVTKLDISIIRELKSVSS